MGKPTAQFLQDISPDVPAKEFWRDNERFADLFNAIFYNGKELIKSNRKSGKLHGADEFLSGMRKTDKLIPCCTIVVYWGEKPWDGPRALKDMMQFDQSGMSSFFCDYSMNLVCVNDSVNYPFHNKDVKDLFQTVRDLYRTGGKQLSESLREVRLDVAYTAAVITGTTKEYSSILQQAFKLGKECINMCDAVKQAFAEERQEGIREGRQEGRQEALKAIALKLLKKENGNYNAVANMLDISADQIKEWEQA